ncbi:MAG TPA: DinB family protein [Thermoanaerobaculia bacterium]|nr:DinB family protein [Thermoanaerobaculia bacterium]
MKTYRQGWLGALMDEYERAAGELTRILEGISDEDYALVRDTETRDEQCRSIRTILTHVLGAGYGYAGMLRKAWGLERIGYAREAVARADAPAALRAMLDHTVATLEGKWSLSEDEGAALQIRSGWGAVYDLEQLLEHAIVHVLRHRRQIERFLHR